MLVDQKYIYKNLMRYLKTCTRSQHLKKKRQIQIRNSINYVFNSDSKYECIEDIASDFLILLNESYNYLITGSMEGNQIFKELAYELNKTITEDQEYHIALKIINALREMLRNAVRNINRKKAIAESVELLINADNIEGVQHMTKAEAKQEINLFLKSLSKEDQVIIKWRLNWITLEEAKKELGVSSTMTIYKKFRKFNFLNNAMDEE
jgi:hypothetical protein